MFRFWQKLGLKRRFLAFFLLASVLPLLVFSFLFMQKTKNLVDARNAELLQTGMLLSQEFILDELDRLGLMASHLASLAVGDPYAWNPKATGRDGLPALFKKYLAGKNADFLILIDPQSRVAGVFSRDPAFSLGAHWPASIQQIVHSAQGGNIITSLEQVSSEGQPTGRLVMLAAAPLYSMRQAGHIHGVLLLGKEVQRLNERVALFRLPLDLKLTILQREGARAIPVLSNQKRFLTALRWSDSQLNEASQAHHLLSLPLDGVPYFHRSRVIQDSQGKRIGYLLISVPEQSLNELGNQNKLFVFLFLLGGMFLVTLLGTWFSRTFIVPLDHLSAVSEVVSAGDLSARVETDIPYEELRRTLLNFNQMLDQLQEKEQLKRMFISTLTHDLRTPLIAQQRVVQFLEATIKPHLDSRSLSLWEGLARSNRAVLNMVNQVLETYQYDEGHLAISLQRTHLGKLVTQCYEELQALAEEKEITLENQVPSELELPLDAVQFRRVILNLVGNAIENLAPGNRIRVSAACSDAGNVRIQVSDDGPGIEPELIPQLFQRYPQQVGRRQNIGSGLGLYICKMIVGLHGGTIALEPTAMPGTTFNIDLPLK